VDLGAAAQADQKRLRAAAPGRRPDGLRPVLATQARPVAVERVDGQDVAADDEPPLAPAVHHPDAP
jgi:hypothetical protein